MKERLQSPQKPWQRTVFWSKSTCQIENLNVPIQCPNTVGGIYNLQLAIGCRKSTVRFYTLIKASEPFFDRYVTATTRGVDCCCLFVMNNNVFDVARYICHLQWTKGKNDWFKCQKSPFIFLCVSIQYLYMCTVVNQQSSQYLYSNLSPNVTSSYSPFLDTVRYFSVTNGCII